MPGPIFLEGDRVDLRTVEEEDLDFLQTTLNDPTVRRFLGNHGPINGEQEQEWYEESCSDDESVNLLITVDDEAVGSIGLHTADPRNVNAEIGIFLAEDYWGEGYGTEASHLITNYAIHERRIHRVVARVFEGNEGSHRIWQKLGFRHEATFSEAEFIDGEFVDIHFYAVLDTEWDEQHLRYSTD
ncbi:MAG TPA: GNAT family protein [Halococcus sp.]|nr:GNAT family protein [Halococcus sp.]